MTVVSDALHFLPVVLAATLLLAAGLLALTVGFSFVFAWREQRDHPRPLVAIRLLLTEFTSLLLTLLLRPLGWRKPVRPRGPARQVPVLLLHGLFQNRSCMLPLQRQLQAAGYDRVIAINTPPWRSFDSLVATVATTVEAICRESGHSRICLVGHSMGGILARGYLQQHGGSTRVAACVTIGSPHSGSKLAKFAVTRLGRELLPGSRLLTQLNATPLPHRTTITALYSRHDNIIVPFACARLDGASNIELSGLGHTALLFSPTVVRAIVSALGRDHD